MAEISRYGSSTLFKVLSKPSDVATRITDESDVNVPGSATAVSRTVAWCSSHKMRQPCSESLII